MLLEHPWAWSHDILGGETFGRDLTSRLKRHLKGRAGLQLIRRPGREGRRVERPHLYVVHTSTATAESLRVGGPEDILSLDLETPLANGGANVEFPLLLVCTHGRRDVCCALKGRPLAAALADGPHGNLVWETSHTKGHRFAPAMLLMPWGYSYGRLNAEAARSLLTHACAGEFFLPGNRGRGLWSPAGQVAEIAVATALMEGGERLRFDQLTVVGDVITHIDGRSWAVELRDQEVDGIIASCSKPAKTTSALVATSVRTV